MQPIQLDLLTNAFCMCVCLCTAYAFVFVFFFCFQQKMGRHKTNVLGWRGGESSLKEIENDDGEEKNADDINLN